MESDQFDRRWVLRLRQHDIFSRFPPYKHQGILLCWSSLWLSFQSKFGLDFIILDQDIKMHNDLDY